MQFMSTINDDKEVFEINYSYDMEFCEVDLGLVEVYNMDGNEVPTNFFTMEDWETIRKLCELNYEEMLISRAGELRWD
jgi:hypothetical protein